MFISGNPGVPSGSSDSSLPSIQSRSTAPSFIGSICYRRLPGASIVRSVRWDFAQACPRSCVVVATEICEAG